MPQLDLSFWLGLVLAIPLSILGNMLTPRAQQYFAKRTEQQTIERLHSIRTELEDLEALAKDPASTQFEMIRSVLFITFLGAFFGVISGTTAMLADILPLGKFFAYSSRITAILGGVMVMKEAFEALIKARNVKFLDKHREVLNKRIRELEQSAG